MNIYTTIVLVYAAIAILAGIVSMAADKSKAKRHAWRIPEATLFLIALVGGGIGSTLGMHMFRHKTKHWYFVVGMPLLALVNVVMYIFLIKWTMSL